MNDKKDAEDLAKIITAGDAWLLKYGIVSPVTHNNIVANLYVNFPKVKFVEYFMPQVAEERWIRVVMHFPSWYLVFKNKDKIIDQVVDLLTEYLHEYDVTVELKRYKKAQVKA